MATLDELVVRIKADASQLDRELRRVNGTVRQSATQMGGALTTLKGQFLALVPALSAATVVAFGKAAVDAAGRINDLGQQIGFAATTLSALETPLARNGATLDQFGAAVNLMNANIGQAASGGREMIRAFDALGLSVTTLLTLSPEEQFYAITEALAGVEEQYKQTDVGRAIFGRGFANLLPLIKEGKGDLREIARTARDLSDALGESTLTRIDAFGDALSEAAIRARNAFLEALAAILRVTDEIDAWVSGRGMDSLQILQTAASLNPMTGGLLGFLGEKTGKRSLAGDPYGPNPESYGPPARKTRAPDARGGNAGLLKSSESGAGTVLPPDYDEGTFNKYLRDLQDEAEALRASDRELAVRKALTEAQSAAQKDYADGLRDTALLHDTEREKIEALAGGYYDLKQQIDDNRETAREWQKQLADGLTDLVLNFDNARDAAKGFFDEIARQILNKKVTGPLSSGIMDLFDDMLGGSSGSSGGGFLSSIGDLFGGFFADGGRPPIGKVSVVGDGGEPELFIPDTAGTIVPFSKMNGQTIQISNSWSIGSGVTRQELANMIPVIEARTRASVFAAIERGGREASLVNRKN